MITDRIRPEIVLFDGIFCSCSRAAEHEQKGQQRHRQAHGPAGTKLARGDRKMAESELVKITVKDVDGALCMFQSIEVDRTFVRLDTFMGAAEG